MGHQKSTRHIGELISLPSKGSHFTPPIYKKKRWPGQCHSGFLLTVKCGLIFLVSSSPCVYKLSVLQIKNFLHITMSVYNVQLVYNSLKMYN